MTISDFDYWIHQFTESKQVPTELRLKVKPEIVDRLGEPVDRLFPDFARDFPRTVSAMMQHWPMPKLLVTSGLNATLVLERADSHLFFDISFFSATEGPEYFRKVAMLPPQWRELYRFFNSFNISTNDICSIYWTTTPFSYSSRISADMFCRIDDFNPLNMYMREQAMTYAKFDDINFDHFDAFVADVQSVPLSVTCWCLNDALDTLWINEMRRDGVVHYVPRGDFKNPIVLEDPGRSMDCYLAQVVSGKSVHEFDFSTC